MFLLKFFSFKQRFVCSLQKKTFFQKTPRSNPLAMHSQTANVCTNESRCLHQCSTYAAQNNKLHHIPLIVLVFQHLTASTDLNTISNFHIRRTVVFSCVVVCACAYVSVCIVFFPMRLCLCSFYASKYISFCLQCVCVYLFVRVYVSLQVEYFYKLP